MLEGTIPYLKRALLVAVVLCIFSSFASLVSAQAFPPGSSADPSTVNSPTISTDGSISRPTLPWLTPGSGGNTNNGNGTGDGTNGSNVNNPDIDTEPVSTPTEPPPPEPQVIVVGDCWVSPAGFLNCLVVSFFGNLAALAGSAFDGAVGMFVVGFGHYYVEYGIGYTVENVWGTIRDIFNLTFIFGLVYIGFQIILGVNESSAKRTIPLLILAALLVNFSLFAVKFVVDFSNFAAVQIYTLYQVGDQDTPTTISPAVDILRPDDGGVSIALAFTNQMGVTGLLNNTAPMDEAGAGITYMFTMVIIFLVLAYVFLAGAILITIRFAVLIFYMIFSPVMFLGWVLPGFASYSKKFWHGLLGQAFFAPALLFMLYISYRVMQGFDDGRRTGGETFGGAGTDFNVNSFAIFIPYLIINVVFIFGSLVVARKMGAVGADSAISIGNKLQKAGRGALWAGTGGAAIGGLGYAGYKATDKMANSENRAARFVGRGLTYMGARDKAEKAYKGSVQGQWKENRKKQGGEMANRAADTALSRSIARGLTASVGSQEQIDFERAIQNGASQSQIIKALGKQTPGSDGYNRIVRAMSHAQVKSLLDAKDDVFGPADKNGLRSAYTSQTQNRLTEGTGANNSNRSLPEAISRASIDDLAALGTPVLMPHAYSISAARMDDLRGRIGATEFNNLNNARTTQMTSMLASPVSRDALFMNKSDQELARLPMAVLSNPASIPYLNRNVLDIMMRGNSNNSYVNVGDRQTIHNLITGGQNFNHPNVRDMLDWLQSPRGQGFAR